MPAEMLVESPRVVRVLETELATMEICGATCTLVARRT